MLLEEQLLKIFKGIESTCSSAVKLFDPLKHSARSVGLAAYDERQQWLLELSDQEPDTIQFLCKKSGHFYFKFRGRVIRIVSCLRSNLGSNIFKRVRPVQDELDIGPLYRIIYQVNYNLELKEAVVLECHYLELDRNTGAVLRDIDILSLHKRMNGGYLEEVNDSKPEAVELAPATLLFDNQINKVSDGNAEQDE